MAFKYWSSGMEAESKPDLGLIRREIIWNVDV